MKIIKTTFQLMGVLGLLCVLAACGTGQPENDRQDNTTVTSGHENTSSPFTDDAVDPFASITDPTEQAKEDPSILVAYFSCTGNTKALAEAAADVLHADLYEIVPEVAYTDDDLNDRDENSRTRIEQNDVSARPVISGSVEDMDSYDVIFLGYPIWWGQAPKIICTFLESASFDGKIIVPFCTSGSSGIGSSAENLHELVSEDVTWLAGTRFGSGTTKEEIAEWIQGLDRVHGVT